jgi:hypothetical protein
VLRGHLGFFHLTDDADPVRGQVDACFDLAAIFNQHPDTFLDKPIDDLAFYVEATVRLQKRQQRKD